MPLLRDTSTNVSLTDRTGTRFVQIVEILSCRSSPIKVFKLVQEARENHFKWISIRRFICFAYVLGSSPHTFDIFSKAYHFNNVRIYDFILITMTVGVTYMTMDFFIVQYTRKNCFSTDLNPLMRGITIGILVNTGLLVIVHSMNLLDSIHFLTSSFKKTPVWSRCPKNAQKCIPTCDVVVECNKRQKINLTSISTHFNYNKFFASGYEYNMILSEKIFVIGLVWTTIFILSSTTDSNILKVFKFAFLWRLISTIVAFIILIVSEKFDAKEQLGDMLSMESPQSFLPSVSLMCKVFGVGSIGVYDFGTMSPLTMVDNAVVVFALVFLTVSFITSFIVKFLYNNILTCIMDETSLRSWHYFMYCILPLSAEFANTQKFYMMYVYINFVVGLFAYIVLTVMTISLIIHNEFRFFKLIYIVGILCITGYLISIPMFLIIDMETWIGLILGVELSVLYLAGCKAVVVFWVYGLHKFTTDINFLLGFKPTKFWQISWAMLPVFCYSFLGTELSKIIKALNDENTKLEKAKIYKGAIFWLLFIALIVAICHVRTVLAFLMKNNLLGLFRCNKNYGPLDKEDRKRRQNFKEADLHRKCIHRCIMLDDKFECNHMPLAVPSAGDTSLTNIYEVQPSAWNNTSQTDVLMHSKIN